MNLSPEIEFDDIEDDSEVIETSRTYRIDFENGRITNELIAGLEELSNLFIWPCIQSGIPILFSVMTLEMSFKRFFLTTRQQTHIKKWRSRD